MKTMGLGGTSSLVREWAEDELGECQLAYLGLFGVRRIIQPDAEKERDVGDGSQKLRSQDGQRRATGGQRSAGP
jgi:hypothetical protein